MSKVIGIIGSRRRNESPDLRKVWDKFSEIYEDGDKICSGGCPRGGDRFAEIIANRIGLTIDNNGLILHKPKPVFYGSPRYEYAKANFARNTLVARDSDVLIAVVADDRKGGTEDTIKKYIKFGKDKVYLV